jgi:hypothetical protein
MSRSERVVRIFARGNADVRDSLLWSRVGGVLQWNGINEVLRASYPGVIARVKHETCARIDLLPLPGETLSCPSEALARRLPSGAHPIARQHRSALFDAPADAVVLSLQSTVVNFLVRHKREGWLLLPDDIDAWDPDSRAWLQSECENAPSVPLETIMKRLEQLVDAVHERLGAPVLVYNLSPVVPGEQMHSWLGAEDALGLRVRRFNLGLAELSTRCDFSIVDVERIVACAGAARLKVDLVHLTDEGLRLVAAEVARILAHRGCFDPVPS